jgi:amino acid transporter
VWCRGGVLCPQISIPSQTLLFPSSWNAFGAVGQQLSSLEWVLWTAFGSVFALLLGYSRVPYAAAIDGYFFKIFGRLHPRKTSIRLTSRPRLIAIVCSFFSLGMVIDALITTRILFNSSVRSPRNIVATE